MSKQTPIVSWSQRKEFINLNVEITDAKNVQVSFTDEGLVRVNASNSDDKDFELQLELFNQIRAELCKYKVTGRKIELRIEKLVDDVEFWPRLTKSKEKNRNITIDWSRWVDDEDEIEDEEEQEDDESNWMNQNQFLNNNNQSLPEEYDEENEEDYNEDDEENEEEEKIHDGEYVWYENLETKDALYQHFIDSYRLRVEDDYSLRGKQRGLYAQEDPLQDFKKYLGKAKERKVFPEWWTDNNEQEMIHMALNDEWANIKYAVEKHDIQDKYNAITPLELRALAELVLDKNYRNL
ncbi:predicted protein [Naegleria gruberi]|uniref:Predicted protein n=1 Tax=Naegleria gruberi TaxID=5762 RepID=D2V1P0_NAEGR|nr:uncharacterized protein NAEGRDRAFT_62643 [Naegleria gruberi]EFC49195.1 predicted protein [Naegleria gruberi]|eukprot:XP_002681939.1 predicted protein [Naegleria gruberi strain NEG-M]